MRIVRDAGFQLCEQQVAIFSRVGVVVLVKHSYAGRQQLRYCCPKPDDDWFANNL
jgi:hypothetical protein